MKQILIFILIFLWSFSAFAQGGKLFRYEPDAPEFNWEPIKPKVVVAFGLIEPPAVVRYQKMAQQLFEESLRIVDPRFRVEVIESATGSAVVDALTDPETVGFIFVSHTYQAKNLDATISIGADGFGLPPDILSSATPSLKFVGIFGCHGPEIFQQYDIEYEFEKVLGKQVYYSNQDQLLLAGFLGIDNLGKLFRKMAKDLEQTLPKYFYLGKNTKSNPALGLGFGPVSEEGEALTTPDQGKLTIRVKDVTSGVEPRYVRVNGWIVGMLGNDDVHSNHNKEYEEFTYAIPSYALKSKDGSHRVKISSSEMSSGSIADNYLIQSAVLEISRGASSIDRIEKNYEIPWHIGDREDIVYEMPARPGSEVSLTSRQYLELKQKAYRYYERKDRDPEVWKNSVFKGRIYSDRF